MSADALTVNLLLSASAVAVVHTALGPDHTLPFVMLARARRWSLRRTLIVTALCGLGHVGSSLLLGSLGLAAGLSNAKLGGLEASRGSLAAWAMIAFGAVYALWGARRAWRERRGLELHAHAGHVHLHAGGAHAHSHGLLFGDRAHAHELAAAASNASSARFEELPAPPQRSASFWTLFLVFVLGPCEPLIPLYFLPASQGRWALASWTAIVFSIVTLATMLALVAMACLGLRCLPLARFDRWAHALAGGVIALSGMLVLGLGL